MRILVCLVRSVSIQPNPNPSPNSNPIANTIQAYVLICQLFCPIPILHTPGVFIARGREDALVTRNLVPGESVYGEKRISVEVGRT